MEKMKVYLFTAVTLFAVSVLGVAVLIKGNNSTSSASNKTVTTSPASAEIEGDKSYDWGDIDIDGGNVEKTFQLKNIGGSDLEIMNFKTSCMCTEVKVTVNGKDSPNFGMHTKSRWKGLVKPNQSAEIHVVFDPMFHGPQAVGPIIRLVSFNTNDPNNPTLELKLTGTVIKK